MAKDQKIKKAKAMQVHPVHIDGVKGDVPALLLQVSDKAPEPMDFGKMLQKTEYTKKGSNKKLYRVAFHGKDTKTGSLIGANFFEAVAIIGDFFRDGTIPKKLK